MSSFDQIFNEIQNVLSSEFMSISFDDSSSDNREERIHVRQIIKHPEIRKRLVNLLPRSAKDIKNELKDIKSYYPATLIKLLPNSYSDFGIVTEYLLRLDSDNINSESLSDIVSEYTGVKLEEKTLKLMTTKRYLNNVKETREILESIAEVNNEDFIYDKTLALDKIEGNPDILTESKIFEVKTSGKPHTDWFDYLLQIFSYLSISNKLELNHKNIYIVLPLQEVVCELEAKNFKKSEEFLNVMLSIFNVDVPNDIDLNFGRAICYENNVGSTIPKTKGRLVKTLESIKDYSQPFQFFLNGNTNTKVTLGNSEMDEAREYLISQPQIRAYCHMPYTISLGNRLDDKDGFALRSLTDYTKAVTRIGLLGGVVHVGKANVYSVDEAVDNMRAHILECLEFATVKSPILLETPAGQGQETLTTVESFMEFMDSIPDERFNMCLDTCHVFSTGIKPGDYITKLAENPNWIKRLKLIHFNDSKGGFGCCVDRHASIGAGKIDKQDFLTVAYFANLYNIPMVIE